MVKNYPKITIITPTYGQGQYIEQTIESVLDQNYPNLEYFIFDGGSKDNTVDIIKKYEKHISFWVSEKDKGQSDAINKGLTKSTGEIINWLNSDDYYEPNCLHTIAENFQNEKTNVVCGRSKLFKGNSEIVRESQGTDIYLNNLAKTIGWARIDQPETFFRKSAIEKMGLLDSRFHYVMDKEWWIRYLLLFGLDNIKEIDKKLVNFRLHEESKTVSQQDSFGVETASMYYNIANTIGQLDLAKTINNNETLKEELAINIDHKIQEEKKELLLSSLHYYLIHQADYFYSINEREKCKNYLKIINTELINDDEKKRFSKLKFRNQFLPTWLKNLK